MMCYAGFLWCVEGRLMNKSNEEETQQKEAFGTSRAVMTTSTAIRSTGYLSE